jgi:hypothetical protein
LSDAPIAPPGTVLLTAALTGVEQLGAVAHEAATAAVERVAVGQLAPADARGNLPHPALVVIEQKTAAVGDDAIRVETAAMTCTTHGMSLLGTARAVETRARFA